MSLHDKIHAIEETVKAEFHKLSDEAKTELQRLFSEAKADAEQIEAQVKADIRDQLLPRLEQLKAEAAVAVEAAGPDVTAAVTKVIDAFVADLTRLAGAED
jgi:vacuolar-type H+-ATPase subunit E/Vma4